MDKTHCNGCAKKVPSPVVDRYVVPLSNPVVGRTTTVLDLCARCAKTRGFNPPQQVFA